MNINDTYNVDDWPFSKSGRGIDDQIVINARVLSKLDDRSRGPVGSQRSTLESTALSLEVAQIRDEKNLTRESVAQRSGLDAAFLVILENGKALGGELSLSVIRALEKGLRVSKGTLDTAYGISGHRLNRLGIIIERLVQWGQPQAQLAPARNNVGADIPTEVAPVDDLESNVSFQPIYDREAGTFTISFYELGKPDRPFSGWNVQMKTGLNRVIAEGILDAEGRLTLPTDFEIPQSSAWFTINNPKDTG